MNLEQVTGKTIMRTGIISLIKWVILKYATTHNHPKITQKSQNLSKTVMLTFGNDMKQWYIYMCACLCV